jgi:NADH-quinone oxidoreductase subunit E
VLSEEEKAEIRQVAEQAGQARAAGTEALLAIQRRRGYVPDEELAEAAELLDMSPTELEGVATFFSLIFRRPVGTHVILVCDGISCYIMGKDLLVEHLQRRLGIGPGETTEDGLFTVLPVACLGCCDRAPAMMIGEELYGDLTCERVDEILDSYREGAR